VSLVPARTRLFAVWRRVLSLSWPVTAEHVLRTLMRTVDIVVTGLFSPAAISAIGLADLYARLPLRIGLGLGAGGIALSSQDTGRDATGARDEAIAQALLLGLLSGLPFAVFGVLLGEWAIALLGAPGSVARMGGAYLAIVFATSPARHVGLVAARALQGTGDTRTPMYVNGVSNGLNIVASVALGLGIGPFPELAIVGVGLATALGNAFTAVALTLAIASSYTDAGLSRPRDLTIAKQLLRISLPKIGEGVAEAGAEFPFNALLVAFGTEVHAGYQVGRRVYQQFTSPLSRGYNVGASIVVGQSLGEGDADEARYDGWATAALGLVTVGALGAALVLGAEVVAQAFTDDPATLAYGTGFARAYGVAAPFLAVFVALSGALQGGSDTRTPLLARVTGLFGFFLGFSYLASVVFGYGVVGVYAGVVLHYVWSMVVVAVGFHWGGWAGRAASMMEARSSADD